MTDIRALHALHALDSSDLERLIEAMEDQRQATLSGDRSGYGQSRHDEMNDIYATIAKLQAAL